CGQLGGVAALHLVHGEDHAAVRVVSLDLAARFQRGLEFRPYPHASGDLLEEDLVAGDAVCFRGVELGPEFLSQVRAARVADPDVGRGRVAATGAGGGVPGRHRCPGPRSAGVGTRSLFASRGTFLNRPVWYVAATVPDRDRHGETGSTEQRGHGCRSTSSALTVGVGSGSRL